MELYRKIARWQSRLGQETQPCNFKRINTLKFQLLTQRLLRTQSLRMQSKPTFNQSQPSFIANLLAHSLSEGPQGHSGRAPFSDYGDGFSDYGDGCGNYGEYGLFAFEFGSVRFGGNYGATSRGSPSHATATTMSAAATTLPSSNSLSDTAVTYDDNI